MINKIKFDRFEIPYKVYGSSDSYIICVNGVQQTMAVWRSFISYFSKRYSIVIFDFPGQGRAKINHGNIGISFDEQTKNNWGQSKINSNLVLEPT